MGKIGLNICSLFIIFLFSLLFAYCSDYSVHLGNNYTYAHEGIGGNRIFHEHPAKGGEIPPDVISYGYDKQFIIAKQKPNEFDSAYETEYVYSLGRDTVYYWLIIKEEQKVFGPMDINEFNEAKKRYDVPDELKLE